MAIMAFPVYMIREFENSHFVDINDISYPIDDANNRFFNNDQTSEIPVAGGTVPKNNIKRVVIRDDFFETMQTGSQCYILYSFLSNITINHDFEIDIKFKTIYVPNHDARSIGSNCINNSTINGNLYYSFVITENIGNTGNGGYSLTLGVQIAYNSTINGNITYYVDIAQFNSIGNSSIEIGREAIYYTQCYSLKSTVKINAPKIETTYAYPTVELCRNHIYNVTANDIVLDNFKIDVGIYHTNSDTGNSSNIFSNAISNTHILNGNLVFNDCNFKFRNEHGQCLQYFITYVNKNSGDPLFDIIFNNTSFDSTEVFRTGGSFANNMFNNSNIRQVIGYNYVGLVGMYTFIDCSNMTKVTGTITRSTNSTQYGQCGYMFYNASSLTCMDVAINVDGATITSNQYCISMFYGCSSLTPGNREVEFVYTGVEYGQYAFNNCPLLTVAPNPSRTNIFDSSSPQTTIWRFNNA